MSDIKSARIVRRRGAGPAAPASARAWRVLIQPAEVRSAMVARVVPVSPFDLVVFGGTGDLTRRKLLPALYYRDLAGQLPEDARIICVARSELSAQAYRGRAQEALKSFVPAADLNE